MDVVNPRDKFDCVDGRVERFRLITCWPMRSRTLLTNRALATAYHRSSIEVINSFSPLTTMASLPKSSMLRHTCRLLSNRRSTILTASIPSRLPRKHAQYKSLLQGSLSAYKRVAPFHTSSSMAILPALPRESRIVHLRL